MRYRKTLKQAHIKPSPTNKALQVYHSQHPKCQEHVDYSANADFPLDILLITPTRSLIIITQCDIIPMIEGRVLNYYLFRVSIHLYHFCYEPSNKRWRRCGFGIAKRQFIKSIPRNQKKDEIESLCLASIITHMIKVFYRDHILLSPKLSLGLAPKLVPILAQGLVRFCSLQISIEAVLSAQQQSIRLAREGCFFYKEMKCQKHSEKYSTRHFKKYSKIYSFAKLDGGILQVLYQALSGIRFRVKTTLTAPLIFSRLRGFLNYLLK